MNVVHFRLQKLSHLRLEVIINQENITWKKKNDISTMTKMIQMLPIEGISPFEVTVESKQDEHITLRNDSVSRAGTKTAG